MVFGSLTRHSQTILLRFLQWLDFPFSKTPRAYRILSNVFFHDVFVIDLSVIIIEHFAFNDLFERNIMTLVQTKLYLHT